MHNLKVPRWKNPSKKVKNLIYQDNTMDMERKAKEEVVKKDPAGEPAPAQVDSDDDIPFNLPPQSMAPVKNAKARAT